MEEVIDSSLKFSMTLTELEASLNHKLQYL